MDKAPKVFLDLEETIITNWDEGLLINTQVVNQWLKDVGVTDVRIFSFAIWDEKDKFHFEGVMRPTLERALEVNIVEWLSVQEMMQLSKQFSGLQWLDVTDFVQLRGKHGAFFDVCKVRENNCTCILLDDAIPHETLLVHHRNLTLELKPVQQLINAPWTNWAP